MEMLFYEFSHKLKRFCKHMKPNVTAVPGRLKRARKDKQPHTINSQERGTFRKLMRVETERAKNF